MYRLDTGFSKVDVHIENIDFRFCVSFLLEIQFNSVQFVFIFREIPLVYHNTILIMTHMAITLKEVEDIPQTISAKFQQYLPDASAEIEILLINQLACLLISSLVGENLLFSNQ